MWAPVTWCEGAQRLVVFGPARLYSGKEWEEESGGRATERAGEHLGIVPAAFAWLLSVLQTLGRLG